MELRISECLMMYDEGLISKSECAIHMANSLIEDPTAGVDVIYAWREKRKDIPVPNPNRLRNIERIMTEAFDAGLCDVNETIAVVQAIKHCATVAVYDKEFQKQYGILSVDTIGRLHARD